LSAKQQRPARSADPDLWMVRAVSLRLPVAASWKEEQGRQAMTAALGTDFGYEP
jgi:hypothetical protein